MRERPRFRECLMFPIATPEARRDLLVGGTVMFTLLIGWILNLGHRLDVVHRLCHGDRPYHRGFAPWGRTFRVASRRLPPSRRISARRHSSEPAPFSSDVRVLRSSRARAGS